MEKLYKLLKLNGGAAIAVGIVSAVVGVACGVVSILVGASLLKNRSRITF